MDDKRTKGEPLSVRLQMAEMHGDIIARIEHAVATGDNIAACWLSYSCFESRVVRTLGKVSAACSERWCHQNSRVGIRTRIDCLKRLRKQNYPSLEAFDPNTLGQVVAWCKERNKLVHGLLELDSYSDREEKFRNLAMRGKVLVDKLYHETTMFREKYFALEETPELPKSAVQTCSLVKRAGGKPNPHRTEQDLPESPLTDGGDYKSYCADCDEGNCEE